MAAPLSAGPFAVIYADPPWRFEVYSQAGEDRSAVKHYPTMRFEEIAALPVAQSAAQDCVLLLWATDPLLPKALELIERWGFTYKTVGFYWVKTNAKSPGFFTGLGYWTRANPEICLLATRGSPERIGRDVPRLVVAARREHSRKPDEMYALIERLVAGPYLEMFSRTDRAGWTAWGLETGKFGSAGGARTALRRVNSAHAFASFTRMAA